MVPCLSDAHLLMGRGTPARSLDQAAADSPFSPLLALQVRYIHLANFLRAPKKLTALGLLQMSRTASRAAQLQHSELTFRRYRTVANS